MIWIGKRVIRMGKFVRNFCRNFTRVLSFDVEVKRSGRRRGGDGFRVMNTFHDFRALTARRNQNALVSIACLRMLITLLLKTKTRIRPVHAHHLCQCPFFSFNPFIDPRWMGRKPEQKGIASAKGSETFFEVYPEVYPLSRTRKQEFNIHSQGK